jgi:hypothetical protein
MFKERDRRVLIPELTDTFLSYCSRHRSPATLAFYRARLKKFCEAYNARELPSLSPLEIDDHLARAGTGMSNSTRHHNVVALESKLIDRPVFGKLEKPRAGQRNRVPTADETNAILSRSSPEFRLIYSALRLSGRSGLQPIDALNIDGCMPIGAVVYWHLSGSLFVAKLRPRNNRVAARAAASLIGGRCAEVRSCKSNQRQATEFTIETESSSSSFCRC